MAEILFIDVRVGDNIVCGDLVSCSSVGKYCQSSVILVTPILFTNQTCRYEVDYKQVMGLTLRRRTKSKFILSDLHPSQ